MSRNWALLNINHNNYLGTKAQIARSKSSNNFNKQGFSYDFMEWIRDYKKIRTLYDEYANIPNSIQDSSVFSKCMKKRIRRNAKKSIILNLLT